MTTYCSTSPYSRAVGRQPLPDQRYVSTEQEFSPVDDLSHGILLGESPAVRRMRSQIERIAPYFRIALVRGERGTGKAQVARALHRLGPGAAAPFVSCSSVRLAEALREGSAGALSALLSRTRGGTLHVQEIDELSHSAQSEMLELLRSPETFRRADTRIVATTERDLRTLAAVGRFRTDLYDRISVVEVVTPPLRERGEDLADLAAFLLARLARRTGCAPKPISEEGLRQLAVRSWPGNLGELERVLETGAQLSNGHCIEAWHLEQASEQSGTAAGPSTKVEVKADRLQDVIQQHVLEVLTRCNGNKLRAAELLGISRSTLYRMLDAGPGARSPLDGAA